MQTTVFPLLLHADNNSLGDSYLETSAATRFEANTVHARTTRARNLLQHHTALLDRDKSEKYIKSNPTPASCE